MLLPLLLALAAPGATPVRHLTLGPVELPAAINFAEGLTYAVEHDEKELEVTIDSPGGSVDLMFQILAVMRRGRKQGMEIRCNVDGMAASAAAIIFEVGCSTRSMSRASQLLFHEPAMSGYEGGKEGDFRRTADALADANKRSAILVAARLGWTATRYIEWIRDRDRWLGWDEALAIGAVDVVTAT